MLTVTATLNDTWLLLQTAKARAEARLEALRGAGVNVNEWLAENVQDDGDDDDDDDNNEADDNYTTDGRLSPAVSAQSDSSDRVRNCYCSAYKILCFGFPLHLFCIGGKIDIFVNCVFIIPSF